MPYAPTRFLAVLLAVAAWVGVAVTVSSARDDDRETWQPPDAIMDAAGVSIRCPAPIPLSPSPWCLRSLRCLRV